MSKKKNNNQQEFKVFSESRPYVLWRRVSTKKQGDSELGLMAQEAVANVCMGREPEKVFTDVYTGTKLRLCKGLWDAIDYCKKNNYVLVVARSDRFRSVSEALEVLDEIGEGNIIFCDLPSSDRFVLTIIWAVWEKQAIVGRINTRVALAECKKKGKNGGWVSRSGNFRTHLGNDKGVDTTNARLASAASRKAEADAWKESSPLYTWFLRQVLKGRSLKDIVTEAQQMYDENPKSYCTKTGKPLYMPLASLWRKEILPMR